MVPFMTTIAAQLMNLAWIGWLTGKIDLQNNAAFYAVLLCSSVKFRVGRVGTFVKLSVARVRVF